MAATLQQRAATATNLLKAATATPQLVNNKAITYHHKLP